ncbi:ArnT family glycosyltransferase [Rhodobacter calidifons]|uniref:Phospholipid carrier-dependent glycosyltransferase n=1 Tax=Rhodobacter calidifons TaxID=2715277 RepID=A0ABX0G840_9RHOB|nr:glycosyltransferase family 39 protein [Rhodobacter calidifons]NHB77394.1 phospholipid carrier-dependent glycosyltransferase [Rhodobacter calidifons]
MTLALSARPAWLGATRGWLALTLFALLAFLPALTALPVVDRDEARFVQASRQMVASRDYIDIRFQDEPRHKKPVGIYWLQSAAVLASGGGPDAPLWVYRLPSLAGAVLSVLLVAVVGMPLFGRQAALLAAAVFAGGLVIGGEARIAKTDAALLATILVAQAVLARLYLRQVSGQGAGFAFWLAIAAGTLIKGPIGPMVPALTVLALVALDRRADWLRPLWSPWPIVLALAVVLPWFIAITLRSEGAFWLGSVGADLLPKITSGQEGKGAPPGSYLMLLWLTFWPATPLLLLALPTIWRARSEPATRFCLAWIVPVWLVYEAVPTKLIHYTLPAYPALALLAVAHLPEGLATASRLLRGLAAVAILPGLALGLAVAVFAITQNAMPAAMLALAGLAGAVVALVLALRSARASKPWTLAAQAALAGALLHAGLISAAARIPALWPTETAIAAASRIAQAQGCDKPILTGWGYGEPSLVWRGGQKTALYPASATAAEVVRPGACQVVVRARSGATAPIPLIPGCRPAQTATGLGLGMGRWVTLDVLDCRGWP